MRTIAVIPELHFPYEAKNALEGLVDFLSEQEPDEVIQAGGVFCACLPGPGNPQRYSLGEAAQAARENFFIPLQERCKGEIKVLSGNQKIPACREVSKEGLLHLLGLVKDNATVIDGNYEFYPDWVVFAEVEGRRHSDLPGRSAMRTAIEIGKNVVLGDASRIGSCSESWSQNGVSVTRVGVESGSLGDPKNVGHQLNFPRGQGLGFVVLHVDEEGNVRPGIFPISNNGDIRRYPPSGDIEKRTTLKAR